MNPSFLYCTYLTMCIYIICIHIFSFIYLYHMFCCVYINICFETMNQDPLFD